MCTHSLFLWNTFWCHQNSLSALAFLVTNINGLIYSKKFTSAPHFTSRHTKNIIFCFFYLWANKIHWQTRRIGNSAQIWEIRDKKRYTIRFVSLSWARKNRFREPVSDTLSYTLLKKVPETIKYQNAFSDLIFEKNGIVLVYFQLRKLKYRLFLRTNANGFAHDFIRFWRLGSEIARKTRFLDVHMCKSSIWILETFL